MRSWKRRNLEVARSASGAARLQLPGILAQAGLRANEEIKASKLEKAANI